MKFGMALLVKPITCQALFLFYSSLAFMNSLNSIDLNFDHLKLVFLFHFLYVGMHALVEFSQPFLAQHPPIHYPGPLSSPI